MERQGVSVVSFLAALVLTGCGAGSVGPGGNQDDNGAESIEMIRPVSAEELPETLATCLQDAGFPPSGIAEDGSREYGPFTEAQDEDFMRADEICRVQYPLEFDYAQDATADDWRRVYDHQKLVWVPCMKKTFGIDLGRMPSEEAFLANPTWVDAERFNLELQQAVTDGSLDHMNAWVTQCPDLPSLDDSEATE